MNVRSRPAKTKGEDADADANDSNSSGDKSISRLVLSKCRHLSSRQYTQIIESPSA